MLEAGVVEKKVDLRRPGCKVGWSELVSEGFGLVEPVQEPLGSRQMLAEMLDD